ncbi:MAG TPA: prephenate dehydrogenase [Tepidisphaeraceae bacterium]|nr:prephenate dehydrogenase [Tepidisphaeraceae bacterium]
MTFERVCILGVGLLGGSLALALRNVVTDCRVVGYGHRQSTLDTALSRDVIHESSTDPAEAVRDADLVVLCTPVGTFSDLIHRIGPALRADAIVTDVGSTKRSIVVASKALPSPGLFVGSHPMAGSEKRGVEYADGNLFQSANCVLTPTAETDATALERVDTMWRSIGMRTLRMTPEEHDARVATASHVPHAVAAALMLLQDEGSLAIAGKGLADTTRIAAGDAGLWRDIFLDNGDNLTAGLEQMKSRIDRLLGYVRDNDAAAVANWLNEASDRRAEFACRLKP